MIVFFTGAGISTESGIPDYRGKNGVWRRDPDAEKLVTYDYYVSDPEIRRRSWLLRAENPAWTAEPNAAHRAIVGVPDSWVITQNVDELHRRAGTPEDRLFELHGSMFRTVCIDCGSTGETREFVARVQAGEDDPRCPSCGGIVKTATVMFGQSLDRHVLGGAFRVAEAADVLVAIGSSLVVQPAAGLVDAAKESGARLIIVNSDPTPYDGLADEIIRDPIGQAVPALIEREGWTS